MSEKQDTACNKAIKLMTTKVVNMIVNEMNKSDMQMMIRQKIINPVIQMIYAELYPYIMALIVTICSILILSTLTFVMFILFYFKK